MKEKVIIIGAGLTGLTVAYLLKRRGINATVLEARDRIGGRIFTKRSVGQAAVDLGATWLGAKHTDLISLLDRLGIDKYPQLLGDRAIFEHISTSPPQLVQLPPNADPSYRIKGGSDALINALAVELRAGIIETNEVVSKITQMSGGFTVRTNTGERTAQFVISTLPPYLLSQSIEFAPELPQVLLDVMQMTHTWMAESIKIAFTYNQPFWRSPKLSGTMFSNAGPVNELYDHANFEDSLFALKGFLNGAYASVSREERLEIVLDQLSKYYGDAIRDYLTYEEGVWANEEFTHTHYESNLLPHMNNGHEVYRSNQWAEGFFVAGTETASDFPGYMEGAVRSANKVVSALVPMLS